MENRWNICIFAKRHFTWRIAMKAFLAEIVNTSLNKHFMSSSTLVIHQHGIVTHTNALGDFSCSISYERSQFVFHFLKIIIGKRLSSSALLIHSTAEIPMFFLFNENTCSNELDRTVNYI